MLRRLFFIGMQPRALRTYVTAACVIVSNRAPLLCQCILQSYNSALDVLHLPNSHLHLPPCAGWNTVQDPLHPPTEQKTVNVMDGVVRQVMKYGHPCLRMMKIWRATKEPCLVLNQFAWGVNGSLHLRCSWYWQGIPVFYKNMFSTNCFVRHVKFQKDRNSERQKLRLFAVFANYN